jgi:transcriptional regulator with XRE-family HTH domain
MSNVTDMNTRLKQFLAAENISQSQFADTIKVVRASVSHVLSGRNNPSYEFMRAIMLAYPRLNMEWLMIGEGKMYKNAQEENINIPEPAHIPSDLLFTDYDLEEPAPTVAESNISVPLRTYEDSEPATNNIDTSGNNVQTIVKQRNVSKIIIMFDDGTFQEM